MASQILHGRCIVVTGAGRGIGRQIALAALDAGAAVVATSRTLGDLETLRRDAGDRADRLRLVVADVTNPGTGGLLVDAAAELAGHADGLVNNAGLDVFAPIWDQDDEMFDRVIATNLTAPFVLSCEFARSWIARRSAGSIVNITSVEAEVAFPEQAPYAASKGGLRQLTAVLALEWAAAGIRVNAVAPGVIESEMTPDRERVPAAADRIPLGRLGRAEEVASAVIHLLTDDASYLTGTTITVDGGFVTQMTSTAITSSRGSSPAPRPASAGPRRWPASGDRGDGRRGRPFRPSARRAGRRADRRRPSMS